MYLVAALNVSNDPTIALLSILIVVGFLVFLKGFSASVRYKRWSVDVLETFLLLNIFTFTISTWYSLGHEQNRKEATAYASVTFTMLILLLIIFYHVYTYTSLFSKVKKKKFGGTIAKLFIDTDPIPKRRQGHYSTPADNDIHRFDELLDELGYPVNTDDYNTHPLLEQTPIEPTFSVVELPKIHKLTSPDPV